MKLKTEMEVLTTRREHFRNKRDAIDKEITKPVTKNTRIEEVWQGMLMAKKRLFRKIK